MTAAELRRRMATRELIDWMAYDRYKGALEDQAQERVKMERKAAQQHKGQRRQR